MLQQSCYRDYYKTLPPPQMKRLGELFEIAAMFGLAVPAAYVVEIERYGYRVNIYTGMVLLTVDGVEIECGHLRNFYELIELAMVARSVAGSQTPAAVIERASQGQGDGQAATDPAFVLPRPSLAQVNGGRYG
jgi:hypothetical protein